MASLPCVAAYHQAGVLHGQGQTQKAGADVPLQQVNQGLEKPGEQSQGVTSVLLSSETDNITYHRLPEDPVFILPPGVID